ncbi:MAG: TatD family hydrolase [Clostridia bacterium]|nr:TatD family hydrolase [Clostridia bacterium]
MREVTYLDFVSELEVGVFDTHAHLYDTRFTEEGRTPESILERAKLSGVDSILIPSDSVETSRLSVDYVKTHDGKSNVNLYCAIGVHPHEAKDFCDDSSEYLRNNLSISSRKASKIQALGEIGLDYHYDFSPRDVQREVFRKQLLIAYEAKIPIILHEREATGDCLEILQEFYKNGNMYVNPGVCHCCSMSKEASEILLKMGFYLGFDGPLTFKNNHKTSEVLINTPLDRIVIETDSPYLTPEPNRGIMNEPAHVGYVLKKIAELKKIDLNPAALQMRKNSLNLYEIEQEER